MSLMKKIKKGSRVSIHSGSSSGKIGTVVKIDKKKMLIFIDKIFYKFSLSTDTDGKKIRTQTIIPIHISNVSLLSDI